MSFVPDLELEADAFCLLQCRDHTEEILCAWISIGPNIRCRLGEEILVARASLGNPIVALM